MARLRVTWRAAAAVWRGHARVLASRLVASRSRLVPVLLVIVGLGGGLAGGALVGEWCLGVVMIAESGLVVFVGLSRDDGARVPLVGELTTAQILERARRMP